jgi:hypothetical protein
MVCKHVTVIEGNCLPSYSREINMGLWQEKRAGLVHGEAKENYSGPHRSKEFCQE